VLALCFIQPAEAFVRPDLKIWVVNNLNENSPVQKRSGLRLFLVTENMGVPQSCPIKKHSNFGTGKCSDFLSRNRMP
jgi:hypothetical protein